MVSKSIIPSARRLALYPSEIRTVEHFDNYRNLKQKGGTLYYTEAYDDPNTAFAWNPQPVEMAHDELIPIDVILTEHDHMSPIGFKPKVSEVLAQIPDYIIDKVKAFETRPHQHQFAENGRHLGVTTLYGDKEDRREATRAIHQQPITINKEPQQTYEDLLEENF
jgi:hypothetical protein